MFATMDNPKFGIIFRILQFSTAAVFAGRAFQHLYWDAPFRAFFWDEGWMSGIVEKLLGIPWDTYITSPTTDLWIARLVVAFGILYAICALLSLLIHLPFFQRFKGLLLVGALGLIFLSFLYYKEKFFSIGQFLEYSLQFGSPIFLWWYLKKGPLNATQIRWMKIATALTFTCHGLYAVNYYPLPGLFVHMTISILGINDGLAIQFLLVAGILDFLISAVIVFLPDRWIKPAVAYAFVWGFLTSLARIWAHFHWEFAGEALLTWTHETVLRFPHFLIPLCIWLYLRALENTRVIGNNRV
ncbi:MAG: hypothetical protein AAF990_02475 [Bacteroidota bacterium]